MISDISYSSLKNSHQIRDYEEKKTIERKRNILYLIAQYLKDEGYCETLTALSNEAQLTNQYQICDNVDLTSIIQDFESYYYVRFQKYPKICKKLNCDDSPYSIPKKCAKFLQRKSVQEIPNAVPKTTTRTQSVPKLISPREQSKKVSQLEGITVLRLGPGNESENLPIHEKHEKILKPLGGLGNQNAEWMSMAEIITKDIFVKDLDVHWDDIMGLEEAKRLLKEAVVYPIKYPELFTGILSPWKGLLLFGPPGTGKTLLAKAVATECKTTFFNISASSIVSKWRGDSEKLVRVMFDLARYHAPSTIFLDELDALASKRDGGSLSNEHEASRRLKTELLIQLDGLSQTEDQVFLLATSNLPWELDPAMLRRLEKRILVDVPNTQAREAMFRHYLPKIVLKQPALKCDIYYEFLAKETEGYSGSDIRLVCKETAMQAIRKVFETLEKNTDINNLSALHLDTITTHDVQTALDKTKPSASHLIQKYKTWQDRFGST